MACEIKDVRVAITPVTPIVVSFILRYNEGDRWLPIILG